MDARLNKPRVFLSHSKTDKKFIERIHRDLRKCQIEPWLDSEDIRHGESWLEAIFQDGISACDCVMVYFSEASLDSEMVKKEIDAGILKQLKEKNISFLPYVESAEIRQKMRPDLQALQAPVWNRRNYGSFFPQVVAEIWRGFSERSVSIAVNAEKVHRLEAELELERIKHSGQNDIFTDSENRDFGYIEKRLDRFEPVVCQQLQTFTHRLIATYKFHVNISSIIPLISNSADIEYDDSILPNLLKKLTEVHIAAAEKSLDGTYFELTAAPEIVDHLLMYGFVLRKPLGERTKTREYKFVYSARIDRFRYWLAFNGKTG
jgi:hypothetical protein